MLTVTTFILLPFAERLIGGRSAGELFSGKASICISCRRKVEKLIKSKDTVDQIEEDIERQLCPSK